MVGTPCGVKGKHGMAGPAPRCPSVLSSPGCWQRCLLMLRSPPGGFAICFSSRSTRGSSVLGQESRSEALLAFPGTVLFTFPSHLVHLRSEVRIYVASSTMPLGTASAIHHLRGSCLGREQSFAQPFLQAPALPAGAPVLAQQYGCPF